MNMSGVQYAATFGLPSKMVLIRGRPKANVLWDAVNIAATTSLREKLKNGREKALKRIPRESKCMTGMTVNKVKACRSSSPRPTQKVLQKAVHTIPNRITF